MQNADLFAYLAGFVTIMLAIALTDMVQSTHRLLRDRSRVKWDYLTPLLSAWLFLWILSEFFGLWVDGRFETLTFYGLLVLIAVPTLTSLAAFAVLPDDVPAEGLDLSTFYYDNRRYLLALLALITLGDLGRIAYYAYRFNGFERLAPWIPLLSIFAATMALVALMYFVRARWAR